MYKKSAFRARNSPIFRPNIQVPYIFGISSSRSTIWYVTWPTLGWHEFFVTLWPWPLHDLRTTHVQTVTGASSRRADHFSYWVRGSWSNRSRENVLTNHRRTDGQTDRKGDFNILMFFLDFCFRVIVSVSIKEIKIWGRLKPSAIEFIYLWLIYGNRN